MEFILGIVLSWYFIGAIIFVGLICEYNDNTELSAFLVIVGAILAKFYFAIDLSAILVLGLVYFLCGLLTALLRWYSYCIAEVNLFNNKESYYAHSFTSLNRTVDPSNNMSKICSWVIIWPIALFTFFTSDLVRLTKAFISKYCVGIFGSISRYALDKVNPIDTK